MAKHYNVRVTVEEVSDPENKPVTSSYSRNDPPANPGKVVLQLVEFKTQRPTMESAAKAAIGAINLAIVEAEDAR